MHIRSFVPVTLAVALFLAVPAGAQMTGSVGADVDAQAGSAISAGGSVDASAAAGASASPGSSDGSVTGGADTSAEVAAGASVYDPQGGLVGTIEAVEAGQAILSTGSTKVRVPVSSFARGSQGVTIAMTKQEVEAAAGKAR